MTGRLPTFLVIGAMRSGTTTLARSLGGHPEVFIPPEKEIHYFDQNFDKPIDWYRGWFEAADGLPAVGEATATYMYERDAPERMAGVVPDARLVAILRNPIDRAYSHYWHERNLRRETLSFREALSAEPERTATAEVLPRLRFAYLDRSRYLPQLQRVCAHFPRERVHVLILEDFQRDPSTHYGRLCRFLGVVDTFSPPDLGRVFNRYASYRSARLRAWTRRLPWEPARRLVGRLNIRGFEYPPMDADLRRELRSKFAEDNAALAEWLGHDLSVWDV
jgi:Sulfotransferase domain